MNNNFNILVVEKDDIVAIDIKQILMKNNYFVDIARGYDEALDIIKKKEIDIIVTEVAIASSSIEEKNGIKLVEAIKKIQNIPVIYITAFSDERTLNRALATNPVSYILKPYKVEEILSAIELAQYKLSNSSDFIVDKNAIKIGFGYFYNRTTEVLYFENHYIKLSNNEKKLLNILIDAKGAIVSYQDIEYRIWKNPTISKSSVRTLLYRLRSKLNYKLIETVGSSGCRLVCNDNPSQTKLNSVKDIAISSKTIVGFNKDQPESSTQDSIDIKNDVDAFAKLISYSELQPPLSIALFGKWGSGKSFFMKELENKIQSLSQLDEKTFCNHIVQIKFNAWHYSDTNLWASLVSHIFNELNTYINQGKSEKDRISVYEKLLDSQKQKIEDKESLKESIEKTIEIYEVEIKTLESKKLDKEIELEQFNIKEVSKEIIQDKTIQILLNKIKEESHITHGKEIEEVVDTYKEVNSIYGVFKRALGFFVNKSSSKTKWGVFLLGLLVTLIGIGINEYWNTILGYIGLVVGYIGIGVKFLKQYLAQVKPFSDKLEEFILKYEDKEKELKENNTKNFLDFKAQINSQNLELEKVREQIQYEINKKHEIEEEIEKIRSGEYLASFISDRSSSDDYKKHLGLITVIREDFDKLKEHLDELNNQELEPKYNIERIVLYIDDLDRCNDEKVIQVLEAIHLLLAFDLFVVVVGVDSRWITNSLVNKYQNTLDVSSDNKTTPYDYLEKIFQIPFKVKPLQQDGKYSLIKSLVANDIEIEKAVNDEVSLEDEIEDEIENDTEPTFTEKILLEVNKIEEHSKLLFSQNEIDFIYDLSSNIGDTPRTVKRFINTYRIVKNHYEIKKLMQNDKEDYKIVLIILSLVFNNVKDIESSEISKDYLDKKMIKVWEKYSSNKRKKQYIEFIKRFSFIDEK